jgi:hypothetical protein
MGIHQVSLGTLPPSTFHNHGLSIIVASTEFDSSLDFGNGTFHENLAFLPPSNLDPKKKTCAFFCFFFVGRKVLCRNGLFTQAQDQALHKRVFPTARLMWHSPSLNHS